ncbi:MAG: hypothetical protein KBT70_16790 [Roseovarius sp.]|uniref:hypothetical protein n=1 Tax=Roseovarius sp. TaxID=1486281 RepID=UPI001B457083|nr:hypothetical protein [Roseovarius sp.]MBQ0751854.1 hypothetical protein [Roseovarius sp.]MBQ0812342.1 hypothetical protein [Roseovarius sp.]
MSEQPVIKTKARTILHVGAGAGKRLAEWQSGGPDKIVLVEAERAAAARLSQKAATAPNVQVVQAALGTEAGDAELSLWNFSRLNSLQEPTPDLHELFPGLIRKDRQIVPVITPADLFAMIGDVARPLSVIVETPGNEMVFLTACKADGVLDQIDQLEILAPEDAVYNGAAPRAELEAWLVHEGFAVTERDNADADWTVLHLAADHNARALSEAKARIDALTKTIVAGEATLSETQSALKAAKERAEMLETALSEARAATDAKTKALAERDAALKAEKGRSEGLQAVLTEARAATETKSRALAERDAALKAAKERAEGVEAALSEARAATDAKTKALAERDAALKAAQERAAGLEAALTEARAATEATSRTLADRDAALKAAKERAEGVEAALSEARAATDAKTKALAERDAALKAEKGRSEGLQAVLTEARAATETKSRALAERDVALKSAQDRAAGLETVLAEERLATEAKAKTLAERDAALKAAQERAEGLEALLTEARAATEAKTKALAERDAAIKAATDKVSDLEATVADLAKQRHSAEQKRDEAMSTLDFQTRFQAMLQVDLEALRGRLEQSETQRQRQEELLGKLTSKLSLAAEYLRHLPPSAQESLTSASKPELESPRRRSSGKKQKTKAAQGRGA